METGVQTLHVYLISLAHIVTVLKNSKAVKDKIQLRKSSLMAECYEAQRNTAVQMPDRGGALQQFILGNQYFLSATGANE